MLRQWPADAGWAEHPAARGKPDRLLIEPTGLGHPKQILDILTAAVYEPWIDLRATLCILDPRQLLDERAVSNDNFRDQLARRTSLWRIKVIGKPRKRPGAGRLVAALGRRASQGVGNPGNIDLTLLDEPRRNTAPLPASAEHAHRHSPLPASPRSARRNTSAGADISTMAGYQGCGWIFDAETVLTPSACSNGRAGASGAR